MGILYRMSQKTCKAWVCDHEGCFHKWMAKNDTPPDKCPLCKRRGWHQIKTTAELIRAALLPPKVEQRMREIALEEIAEARRQHRASVGQPSKPAPPERRWEPDAYSQPDPEPAAPQSRPNSSPTNAPQRAADHPDVLPPADISLPSSTTAALSLPELLAAGLIKRGG